MGFDVVMNLPGEFADWILPDKIKDLNVSFTVNSLEKHFGGTGGNCAIELGKMGKKPRLVSILGKDGAEYLKYLIDGGVDTQYLKIEPVDYSAVGHVMTDKNHNQIWSYYPGPLNQMIDLRLKMIVNPGDLVMLMPSTPEAFVKHLSESIQLGFNYLFDPSFFIPNLTKSQLTRGIKSAKIVIGNDYEMSLMEKKVGQPLSEWLNKGMVVIKTMGEKGSEIYQGRKKWTIPAEKIRGGVDPTGAGDAYRAGLVAGLLEGKPWPVCGKKASVVAANKIRRQQ